MPENQPTEQLPGLLMRKREEFDFVGEQSKLVADLVTFTNQSSQRTK